MTTIELIYDSTCPNIEKARAQLRSALSMAKKEERWQEWERSASNAPGYVRDYGSPTILIDGRDIYQNSDTGGSANCRVYQDGDGKLSGVPPLNHILAALRWGGDSTANVDIPESKFSDKFKKWMKVMPSFGAVALLPFACPACWPFYIGLLGSFGIGFTGLSPLLYPVTITLLLLSLFSLWYKAQLRRGLGPFKLGVVAAALAFVYMFVLSLEPVLYVAAILLISASVWNILPQSGEKTESCPACVEG